jgi:hypothetical protein
MIVAVISVRMMQPAGHQIVDVITMRHRLMSAVWTMGVRTFGFRRAAHGIAGVDPNDMLVDVVLVHVVEMAVVKIVHMAVMANRGMSAVPAMLMGVVGMVLFGAGGHDFVPLFAAFCDSVSPASESRTLCVLIPPNR